MFMAEFYYEGEAIAVPATTGYSQCRAALKNLPEALT